MSPNRSNQPKSVHEREFGFTAAFLTDLRAKIVAAGDLAADTLPGMKPKDVTALAGLRRQIQYAVDIFWPATNPANAGIRAEFKPDPKRALN